MDRRRGRAPHRTQAHVALGERAAIATGERTIVTEEEITIDFRTGTIRCRDEAFRFPALGPVPQALVVAGGIENLVKGRLGLAEQA